MPFRSSCRSGCSPRRSPIRPTLVPAEWQGIYQLNPMVGVIEGFRWALLGQGQPPPVTAVAVSTVVTVVVLVLGLAYFRRVERTFADVI